MGDWELVPTKCGMGVDLETIMRVHRVGMQVVEVPITASYAGLKSSSHDLVTYRRNVVFS